MAKTDLKINATNGYGDDITTTISYVNPDAGKNDILNFTQALNALTTNTYKETQRVQTINVDLETVPSTPTLTASQTQWSAAGFAGGLGSYKQGTASVLTYNGDGSLFVDKTAVENGLFMLFEKQNGNLCATPMYLAATPPTNLPLTFRIGFTATDNYKACYVELTITA